MSTNAIDLLTPAQMKWRSIKLQEYGEAIQGDGCPSQITDGKLPHPSALLGKVAEDAPA